MEQRLSLLFFQRLKAYCFLTKPGILFGNLVTTLAGFLLASKARIDGALLGATLGGICCVMGSACVCNNYLDRVADEKMARTCNRPLVKGVITPRQALGFALVLGILGTLLLTFFTNFLTTAIALFGFFVYVILYTFSKYHSSHGTLIGSVAGAVPPVVGYCAVSNHCDVGAWILFGIITFWQMPHFFSIAIYRLEDYAAAGIPTLPLKKGIFATKIQIFFYILGFLIVSSLLTFLSYAGYGYLIVSLLLGLVWLILSIQGFKAKSDQLWARKMFRFSLIVVIGVSIAISFSVP